jgi:TonB-linked SusC/RagA family outer membrane protein
MNLRLDYRHAFGSHNVNAMVGFEEEYSYSENFYASRHTSLDISYLFAGLDNDKQKGSGGSPSDRASQAFIGRFAYDYQGKYMAEFTFRYDGSSRFPKESRWGFFPTGLVGWRISEESFIKENLSMVNNLKLRASYGIMGDDSSAGNYPPNIVGYNLAPSSLGWLFNGAYYGGVNPTAIPNLELTWYTSKMMNLGVDVETYNGLLGGSVEYFVRNREGLLASSGTVLPGTVGADMPQKNLDSDRVFGYEITLSHRNKIGDVRYFANAQMGTTRHMFLDRTATKAGNSYDHWRNRYENRYDNIWWGTEYGGQYQSYEQIYNFPISAGSSTLPGDYYYKDWNGDGVVNGNDSHPIALTGMPWINYGFSLGAEWKGIDINANFQGSALVYVKYAEALVEPLSFGGAGTMSKFLDRWHPEDPNADYWDPRTVWIKGEYPITGSGLADGTKAIEDASYLRLKTLELGYNLPKKYLNILGVKGLRVYVSGYNVLTFTGLKHTDPEHPGSEGGASNEYVDTYKYPINQSINVGASIKF